VTIADELLVREVLDADQVTRIAAGQHLDEPVPVSTNPSATAEGGSSDDRAERPTIVPPPLNKPLAQE
jgi:hypothetical protein